MTGRFSLLAVVLTAGVLLADEPKPRSKVAVGPRADHLDLIALAGDRVLRIQFQVEIDGKSVCALQDEAFARLFAFVDRDGNGVIDQKEAVRLPSAFSLRQNIWGQFGPYGGQAPSWTELDADGDGKLTLAELIDFHRRAGLGGTVIGIGRSANADVLSSTILKALDTDGDKIVTAKEWQAAPATLSKFDRNDDEMVSPAELVSKVAYPGAIGATMLPAPAPEDRPAKIIDEMPLITLPLRLNDTHWVTALVSRRDTNKDGKLDRPESGLDAAMFEKLDTDKDGKLGPAELLAWRTLEPDIRCRVMLGESKEGKPAFEIIGSPKGAAIRNERFDLAVGNLRLEVRHDVGKLPSALAAARKRIVDRFTQTDVNGDGVIDEKEAAAPARNGDLVPLLAFADRDADGKLTRKEFDAWLDLQDLFANSLVLLTVLDHGNGLFELLDADRDGNLSIREIRGALDRVTSAGLMKDGKYDPALPLPRQLIATASRGHPLTPLGTGRLAGPSWFRAMDRNGDGDVSRREFTGTVADFQKLDTDGDGLISPAEAEAFKLPGKK